MSYIGLYNTSALQHIEICVLVMAVYTSKKQVHGKHIDMQAQVGKALGLHECDWETTACLMYIKFYGSSKVPT
jgi:hypothetical protein